MLGGGLDAPVCYQFPAPASGVHPAGLLIPTPLKEARPRPPCAGRQEWRGAGRLLLALTRLLLPAVGPEAISTPGVSAASGSPGDLSAASSIPQVDKAYLCLFFSFWWLLSALVIDGHMLMDFQSATHERLDSYYFNALCRMCRPGGIITE